MKQLPQNLKDWLDLWVGTDIPKSSVIPQFVEMQQRIDELEKERDRYQFGLEDISRFVQSPSLDAYTRQFKMIKDTALEFLGDKKTHFFDDLVYRNKRIQELEKEKYNSIEAWNSKLEKLTAENAELAKENAGLKAHVNLAHEVIEDIAIADTKSEACHYACSFTDSTKRQSLAQHDKEVVDNFVDNLFSQLPKPPRRVWVSDLKIICEQLQEQE